MVELGWVSATSRLATFQSIKPLSAAIGGASAVIGDFKDF
jgi:hypothetical protein